MSVRMSFLVLDQRFRQRSDYAVAVFTPNVIRVRATDQDRAAFIGSLPILLQENDSSLRLKLFNLRNQRINHWPGSRVDP